MRTAVHTIALGACMVLLVMAIMIGIDREAARQVAHTRAMCKHYGAAMNNWARQNNLTPPCAE